MKQLLRAAFLLPLCFSSCRPGSEYSELARKEVPGRTDIYYNVAGFNAQDTAAWRRLHFAGLLAPHTAGETLVVHFMDTTAFRLPATSGQMCGGPQVMRRVVAQYLVLPDGQEVFEADPSGSGRYPEPK